MATDVKNFCRFLIDGNISIFPDGGDRDINLFSILEKIRENISRKWVKGVVIHFKKIEGCLADLHAFHDGILSLKRYKKPIIAFSVNYNTSSYFVASACTEIWCANAGHIYFDQFYGASFNFSEISEHFGISESCVSTVGKHSNIIFDNDQVKKIKKSLLKQHSEFFLDIICLSRSLKRDFAKLSIDKGIISGENAIRMGMIDKIEREFFIINQTKLCSNIKFNSLSFGIKMLKIGIININREFAAHKWYYDIPWPFNFIAKRLMGTFNSEELYSKIEKKSKRNNCIILIFDSGGGDLAQFQIVRDLILSIKNRVPVYAYCKSMCLSSAYYVASACTFIGRHPTALIGQAGSVTSKLNFAATLSKLGVELEEYIGFRNSNMHNKWQPWSDEQINDIESVNNSIAEVFFSEVENGRKEISSEYLRAGWIAMPNDDSNGFYDFTGTFNDLIHFISKDLSLMKKYSFLSRNNPKIVVNGLDWRIFRNDFS
ncbi:S49 family peptidase [Phenylobacterium sp.]|uniref:S49 family peptidase n=1 Tax=Phenylobacterium sp. TaxID=1871053 RepID=UPI0025F64E50|nr:S49 family peptidase [Phenylobacterium sp.]MCA3741139.1 S49 family peptidase [Phenylobacterium sp.]